MEQRPDLRRLFSANADADAVVRLDPRWRALPRRRDLGRLLGARVLVDPTVTDPVETARALFGLQGMNVSVERLAGLLEALRGLESTPDLPVRCGKWLEDRGRYCRRVLDVVARHPDLPVVISRHIGTKSKPEIRSEITAPALEGRPLLLESDLHELLEGELPRDLFPRIERKAHLGGRFTWTCKCGADYRWRADKLTTLCVEAWRDGRRELLV